MPIQATCQSCDETIRVASKHAGKKVRCPECGDATRIPRVTEETPEPDPEPSAGSSRSMFVFGAAGGAAVALLIILVAAVAISGDTDPLAGVDFAKLERERTATGRPNNDIGSSVNGSNMNSATGGERTEEYDPTKGANGIKFAGGDRVPPPKFNPSTSKIVDNPKPKPSDNANPQLANEAEIRTSFPDYEDATDVALKPIREKLARIGMAFRKLQFEKRDSAALGKDQKLSWLVHLLPYLDDPKAKTLHAKFNLSEAWDSPNNWPLLSEIPDLYQYAAKDKSSTRFRFFEGTGLIYDKERSLSFKQIADGLEHTLLAVTVSGDKAVPWTKPAGIEFIPTSPMDAIGPVYKDRIEAVTCDAKPLSIPNFIPKKIFNALVTPRAGDFADGPSIRHGWGMFPDVQVPGPRLTKQEREQEIERKLIRIGDALKRKYGTGKFVVHTYDKSLLSWRVELLPYLGYDALYKQFNHKEPWFSDQNRKLTWKMPDVFRIESGAKTHFQIAYTPKSVFGLKLAAHEVTDGADQTLLCYASIRQGVWTERSQMGNGTTPTHMLTLDLKVHPGKYKYKEMLTAQGGEKVSLATVTRIGIADKKKKEAAANRDVGKVYVSSSVISKTNSIYASALAWNPKSRYFAANNKNRILFFRPNKGTVTPFQKEVRVDPPDEVTSLGFSQDELKLAAGTTSGKVYVFTLKDGSREIFSEYNTRISSVALNADGSLVAACCKGTPGGIIMDVATKAKRSIPGVGSKYISRVLFSPDGTRLYAGTQDGYVHILDMTSGKELKSFVAHDLGLGWMQLDPEGNMLATGSMTKGVARVWDAKTGDKLMDSTTYQTEIGKKTRSAVTRPVHSLGFYKDRDHLIMMVPDVGGFVYRISTGKMIGSFKGTTKGEVIMGECSSPTGAWHIQAARDKTLNIQSRDRHHFEAHGVYTRKKKE